MVLELLAYHLIFIAWIIGIVSVIPQLILNYRLKSVAGLSDWMLFGTFNAYILGVFYIFSASLPMVYKIMGPLTCLMIAIMLGQRYWYGSHENAMPSNNFLSLVLLNSMLLIGLVPTAYYYPITGFYCGMASMMLLCTYQIPQIAKIYSTKSTEGFSFIFMSLITLGSVLECIAAMMLKLPVVVIMNDMRAIITYAVFCVLFRMYR